MYIRFMANSYSSLASVKNYFSGAKYWVTIHGGDISSFLPLETSEMTFPLFFWEVIGQLFIGTSIQGG